MIREHRGSDASQAYIEQVLRGLDTLEAKLKGCDIPLWPAIDAAFGISAKEYSLAWLVSRQELVVLTIEDGITPGLYCPHINCEELIILVNTRTFMGAAAPVFPRKPAPDLATLWQHWMQILFRTDSEFALVDSVAAGVLPVHLLTPLELSKQLIPEVSIVLRQMSEPEFLDVYWSPTYCSTVTRAIIAYLDHLQERGNISAENINALIHFRASTLIRNLEANSAPGLQLIKDRLRQLSEEP